MTKNIETQNIETHGMVISGCAGRMGRALLEAIQQDSFFLLGAIDNNPKYIGKDVSDLLGEKNPDALMMPKFVPIYSNCKDFHDNLLDLEEKSIKVWIDFSSPEASMEYLDFCRKHHIPIVIGTTGFSNNQLQTIEKISEEKIIPIVFSANMSLGVNLLLVLSEMTANILKDSYDVEIVEIHHRNKKDSPSGTALMLMDVLAKALDISVKNEIVYGRKGVTGQRPIRQIGVSSVRGGDVIGDHTVMFLGKGERIELSHRANDRATFALGALDAAKFLIRGYHLDEYDFKKRVSWLFSMQDVLSQALKI